MGTDELIQKAMMRGRTQMAPWLLFLFAQCLTPYPQPSWVRPVEGAVLILTLLALQWYCSRHPLV